METPAPAPLSRAPVCSESPGTQHDPWQWQRPHSRTMSQDKEQRMPWPAVCPLPFLSGSPACPMAQLCSLASWKQMDPRRVGMAGSLAWRPS